MFAPINRFISWLGPSRAWAIFGLLASTGLVSLMLNAAQPRPAWATLAQSISFLIFFFGAVIIVLSRFNGGERRQMILLIGPAATALGLGFLFPQVAGGAIVVAGGWLVIAPIAFRSRVRREYQMAIKLMRKNDYDAALAVMNDLIKAEPNEADHYRFRAELQRLLGRVKRAIADYEKVAEIRPGDGVGFNGLAEVHLQAGDLKKALHYGQQALAKAPNQWTTLYNLAMIEDRLGLWAEARTHSQSALGKKISVSRHRLLAKLWLLRAAINLEAEAEALSAWQSLGKEKAGLREWQKIFAEDQSGVLKEVLDADVAMAEKLLAADQNLETLITLLKR
jgi:tetratricopeptide (TPR) repeat protein